MFMIYRKFDGIDEVIISEDFTAEDASKIRNDLEYVVRRGKSKLLLNLSSLINIEKKAVSLLYFCQKLCRRRNGKVVILNPNKNVSSLVKQCANKEKFSMCYSRKSAIDLLSN